LVEGGSVGIGGGIGLDEDFESVAGGAEEAGVGIGIVLGALTEREELVGVDFVEIEDDDRDVGLEVFGGTAVFEKSGGSERRELFFKSVDEGFVTKLDGVTDGSNLVLIGIGADGIDDLGYGAGGHNFGEVVEDGYGMHNGRRWRVDG
jgi:hypothetical protein